jgi:hypothetical protein
VSLYYKVALLLIPALHAATLDHVAIAVRDLGAAEKQFRDLGFTIGLRGWLPDGIADSSIDFKNGQYLELITVTDRAKASAHQGSVIKILDAGGGPVFAAFAVKSAAKQAAQLTKEGFAVDGPRPNAWTLDGVKQPFPDGWIGVRIPDLPVFFIEYHNEIFKPLEKIYPILKDDPKRMMHANGAMSIRSVEIETKDAKPYRNLPGIQARASSSASDALIRITLTSVNEKGCRPLNDYLRLCGPAANRPTARPQ